MKNKRLIALISIFAFLILIVILCSTLFTVKQISVNWLTQLPAGHELIGKDDAIASSINKGGSVFLYDKKLAQITLEEKYPYLNVVKLETKFPNQIVLHVADRQEFYALKLNDNCYAVLDGDGKVLNKYNALQYEALEEGDKPIYVEVRQFSLNEADFVVGKVVNISRVSTILNAIYTETLKQGYDVVSARNIYENVVVDLGYNSTVQINTKAHNIAIKITRISSRLNEKIEFGIEVYNSARANGKRDVLIEVYERADGRLAAEEQSI